MRVTLLRSSESMSSVLYLGLTLIWLVCTSSDLMLFFLAMERRCLTLTSVLSLATIMSFSTDSITRVKTTSSGGTRTSAWPVTVISGGSIAVWAKEEERRAQVRNPSTPINRIPAFACKKKKATYITEHCSTLGDE